MQILIITANTLPLKVLFYQAWMALAAWSSLVGLWLAADYVGLITRVSRRMWVLLSLPLLIFTALIATNAATGLVWLRLWDDGGLRSTLGIAGVLGVSYACVLASMCMAILLSLWRGAHGALRWQVTMLAVGGLIISLGFIPEKSRLLVTADSAISSILCSVGLLIVAIAIFRFRAFDLAPVNRQALFEQMSNGVMVLDEMNRVVDLNPAARGLLHVEGWSTVGQDAMLALSAWPELQQIACNGGTGRTEVTIGEGQTKNIFDVSVSPLVDPTAGRLGKVVIWNDVTEMKAAQAEVERQRAALACLEERERVGRELHDGLAQAFGYVKLQAQAARDALDRDRPDEANEDLGSILAISQDAHEEIRDFLLGSRTATRLGSCFWSAVADYVERYTSLHGLGVQVSMPPQANDLNLDLATQAQLLRIIQESLANVRRHAGVSSASLTITCEGNCLHLTVRDDGKGFDPHAVLGAEDDHYGLGFMRQRARGDWRSPGCDQRTGARNGDLRAGAGGQEERSVCDCFSWMTIPCFWRVFATS